jgi:hypothetical protein
LRTTSRVAQDSRYLHCLIYKVLPLSAPEPNKAAETANNGELAFADLKRYKDYCQSIYDDAPLSR